MRLWTRWPAAVADISVDSRPAQVHFNEINFNFASHSRVSFSSHFAFSAALKLENLRLNTTCVRLLDNQCCSYFLPPLHSHWSLLAVGFFCCSRVELCLDLSNCFFFVLSITSFAFWGVAEAVNYETRKKEGIYCWRQLNAISLNSARVFLDFYNFQSWNCIQINSRRSLIDANSVQLCRIP